jgi:hypothetical protein
MDRRILAGSAETSVTASRQNLCGRTLHHKPHALRLPFFSNPSTREPRSAATTAVRWRAALARNFRLRSDGDHERRARIARSPEGRPAATTRSPRSPTSSGCSSTSRRTSFSASSSIAPSWPQRSSRLCGRHHRGICDGGAAKRAGNSSRPERRARVGPPVLAARRPRNTHEAQQSTQDVTARELFEGVTRGLIDRDKTVPVRTNLTYRGSH